MRSFLILLISCLASVAGAADLRPFDSGSPAAIHKSETGHPFVLAFWSTTCEPCREDMRVLKQAQRRHPGLRVHLVSVDPPQDHGTVRAFLDRYDPGPAVRWAFDDDFSERVRYAVDPGWRGELPRTYLFDAAHRRTTHSGVLDEKALDAWIAANARKKP